MTLSRNVNKRIEEELIEIIHKIFSINQLVQLKNKSEKLTGKIFGLRYFELILLLHVIEDYYNISFNNKDFDDYRFNSIEEISLLIKRKIKNN